MIYNEYTRQKQTANQLAKELLLDKMELALEFWQESILIDRLKLTDKEIKAIDEQLNKRYNGVKKYLGY
jgi:broad specificity phosphatase PhoE